MKSVLITGINGFVGSWCAEYILNNKPEIDLIIGTKRINSDLKNINHLLNNKKLKLIDVDLEDSNSIKNIFKYKFDKCFHLAAQSSVKFSFEKPVETINTNVIGTINLLEDFRRYNPECVILISGSSEQYGNQKIYPIIETAELNPLSPYGVSKVAQEKMAYQYCQSYGLKTIITRSFNHEGPRRGINFVTSSFARQIIDIEKGIKKPLILHGNLEAQRDFIDVRDIVKAYWVATEKCIYGESYNICSGKCIKIEDMLNYMINNSTVKNIKKELDTTKLRPLDLEKIEGSNLKFVNQTGWGPEINIEQTFIDILNYWRNN